MNRENIWADLRRTEYAHLNKHVPRDEGKNIVTGMATYIDDLSMPGMLRAKMLRSPIDRGRITKLDVSPAYKVDGVIAVITREDVPCNTVSERYDTPVFPENGELRHRGQPIACVAATSEEAALEGVKAIILETEEWPAVLTMEESVAPNAIQLRKNGNIHFFTPGVPMRRIRKGDVEKGFAEADYIVEGHYDLAPVEHAPIETQSCLAHMDFIDRVTLYTTTQQVYTHQNQIAVMLQLPLSKLRLIGLSHGGGFGGKSDMPVEVYAALLAMKTRRPVKFTFTRQEEMTCSSIRGQWQMHYKDGVTKDGRLVARYCKTFLDSGPSIGLGPYCIDKGSSMASGPYTCPNIWLDARLILTNKAKASSLRGLGIFSSMYASETQMSRIAATIGMDPIEFRMKNLWREGETNSTGMAIYAVKGIECMQKAAELAGIELPQHLKELSSLMAR